MTQMIYRLHTNERRYDGQVIEKTQSKGVKLDALVVDEDSVPVFCSAGWFESIDSLFNKPEEPKKPAKKVKVKDD